MKKKIRCFYFVVDYNKTKEHFSSSTENVQKFQREFEASKWTDWTDQKEKK